MVKAKHANWWLVIVAIIIAVVVVDLYYFFEFSESAEGSNRNLADDGFCCFSVGKEAFNQKGREENERDETLKRLPPDYEFLDYDYTIYSAALSTFHRDVTSSQVLYGCVYPVYTLIVYEYGGDLLSVCPASERTWPFVLSRIVNLSGPPGTCVLFNSEILHAGQPNQCRPRLARQYKICNRKDIKKLEHLMGVRAVKDMECMDDIWSMAKRKISYYFAFLINHVLYPFLMQKWDADTWMGQAQSLLPDHQFYNNI